MMIQLFIFGRLLFLKDFIERVARVIHWAAFGLSLFVVLIIYTSGSELKLHLQIPAVLFPNACGWLIKYIFTGKNNFFPW